MNKLIAIVALSLCAGFAAAHEGHQHDEKAEAAKAASVTTLKGELVDLGCYLDHGTTGEKHGKCAKMCVTGGAPMGLVTKAGDLYLVVGAHGQEKAFAAAKELAGENASLTGNLTKKGGLQAIMVTKAEKL